MYYTVKTDRVSDVIIYSNIFGEFDNVEDCDAAQLISGVESLWPRCLDNACRRELVRSAGTCKKIKPSRFNSINIIVLIMYLIFIYFVSDHGISGIMPFEVSIIRNNWTLRRTVHASASSNYFRFLTPHRALSLTSIGWRRVDTFNSILLPWIYSWCFNVRQRGGNSSSRLSHTSRSSCTKGTHSVCTGTWNKLHPCYNTNHWRQTWFVVVQGTWSMICERVMTAWVGTYSQGGNRNRSRNWIQFTAT